MKFDSSYFQGEVREDFYIKPMMKKAWAAQLKVLEEIDKICKRHNIEYYAEWGTLLGAVRHHGYIPWDDDLDIGMTRPNYVRFLSVAQKELPEGYQVMNVMNNPSHKELLTRVVNSPAINTDPKFLNEFYGCPYVIGIDIFPSDYLPKSKQEETIQLALLAAVNRLGREWNNSNSEECLSEDEKWDCVREIEEYCNYKFTDDMPIQQQLLILSDRICAMYWDTDADEITLMTMLTGDSSYRLPVSCYESFIEVPFENTTIPIPVGYEKILILRYGKDYMTPVKAWGTHTYPYFKDQQQILFNLYKEKSWEIPEAFKE